VSSGGFGRNEGTRPVEHEWGAQKRWKLASLSYFFSVTDIQLSNQNVVGPLPRSARVPFDTAVLETLTHSPPPGVPPQGTG
jgi:hypothetical protein